MVLARVEIFWGEDGINLLICFFLWLQTIFFVELYPSETRKLVERLINYVIYKVNASC